MKKNKTMRVAGGLLIATMLTSSIVSGTYAKYVTSTTGSDTARVAKFGVVITADGSLFDTTYKKVEDGNGPGKNAADTDKTALTVTSSDKVVAPGTKNDEGLVFNITGTPEVDVIVSVRLNEKDEIFLAALDGLPDMTTGITTDTFDNTSAYYPLRFTLKQSTKATPILNGGTLSELETALADFAAIRCNAGTNLATEIGSLTLTWEWAYDGNDQQDTLLGDLAAGTALVPDIELKDTDYNLNTNIELEVTVTQVD